MDDVSKTLGGDGGGIVGAISGLVGGEGGLQGLVGTLSDGGLGDIVGSWVGAGPNKAVEPARRSVSLTSMVVTDHGRPVGARTLLRAFPPLTGDPVAIPPGLVGWAVAAPAVQPARASRAISGVIATDGRLLLATITGDDLGWTTSTWLSIHQGAGHGSAREHDGE